MLSATIAFSASVIDLESTPVDDISWVQFLAEVLASPLGYVALISIEVIGFVLVKYWIRNGFGIERRYWITPLRENARRILIAIIIVFIGSIPLLILFTATLIGMSV